MVLVRVKMDDGVGCVSRVIERTGGNKEGLSVSGWKKDGAEGSMFRGLAGAAAAVRTPSSERVMRTYAWVVRRRLWTRNPWHTLSVESGGNSATALLHSDLNSSQDMFMDQP